MVVASLQWSYITILGTDGIIADEYQFIGYNWQCRTSCIL